MKKLLICFLMLFSLTGCSKNEPCVATTVYPVQYLVQRIANEYVKVVNISSDTLIQRASIKKNYQKLLQDCDLLFYIDGLEPYMDIYLEDIYDTDVHLYNLANKSAIYQFKRYTRVKVNNQITVVEDDYYDGEVFHYLDQYEKDPILWLDPVAMTSMANDIRDELIKLYPQYESIFNENYEILELDLARLDAEFQELSEKYDNLSFVSMTPSFGNWQKSYGIHVYPICLSRYGALPSKEQLNAIKQRISKDQVRYIAIEQNLPKDFVQLQNELIEELGLIPIYLNNLSSISEKDKASGKDYLSIMYENLKVLKGL